jgi:CheY-like chemotaxis protein
VVEETPRVLIVDDDEPIRRMLSLSFELDGFEVASAGDGLEAIIQVGLFSPDVVVLDIMMPRMDGLTALGHLRRQPETADLPVVLLSAKADSTDIAIGMRAGASDYVTKPFEADDLVTRIRKVIPPSSAAFARERPAARGLDGEQASVTSLRPAAERIASSPPNGSPVSAVMFGQPEGDPPGARTPDAGMPLIGAAAAGMPLTGTPAEGKPLAGTPDAGADMRDAGPEIADASPGMPDPAAVEGADPLPAPSHLPAIPPPPQNLPSVPSATVRRLPPMPFILADTHPGKRRLVAAALLALIVLVAVIVAVTRSGVSLRI